MTAAAQVGRVSPRPQDRGPSCTLLGRELLREENALGLTGRWLPMILRSRRDAPYLARVVKPDRPEKRLVYKHLFMVEWRRVQQRRPNILTKNTSQDR
jgi:hypothetical protein